MLFTQEHEEIVRTVKRFIEQEVNPHVDEWEEAGIFPAHEVFRELGKLGVLGLSKPEAYGGGGLDYSYETAFAEALGVCNAGGVPLAIGVQTNMATPALARFGSDALRAEFLAPAIAGEQVACIGVSEPGAGSDVAAIRTTARKDGDDYVISGTKLWITNGTQADWMCCLANTSDDPAHRNKSLIVVPLKSKGVQIEKKIRKIGMHSSDTAQIFLDEVRVPRRNLIGEEGKGFTYQMLQFQEERLYGAAGALLVLDRAIDQTIDYTRQRKIFGRSVLDNQVVHYRLAELKTEVEAVRALTYRATELYVGGGDVTALASMAKLKAGRLAREVTDSCLQFWGGMGFAWESSISRTYRDSRLFSIGAGADEVMLSIICKKLGTLPRE
ncbi:acyl-CoA dehydrogenase family protein [Paraburkholderia megapolitana]|uniref:acyl-CoA dehydrogenase family protein n=1 Tax=Paraburkholderia megapolitana TaxID=420953 RepID=UPI0038B6D088